MKKIKIKHSNGDKREKNRKMRSQKYFIEHLEGGHFVSIFLKKCKI
jgi:hypothetical protein